MDNPLPDSAAASCGGEPPDPVTGTATQVFNDHRELLFSIVYNMLGTVADTEDVLQETWLSWTARNQGPGAERIDHPRAYLVRIAVNRALAHQAILNRRRETYVGSWLPEPLVSPLTDAPVPHDGADAALRAESVSMALLVILETLTPLERGVFVLHEVFGYAHTEIAEILGRSPAAIRQLAHRAREHVHARRPRYEPDPHVRQQVTERFMAAAIGGDLDALLEILAPDVTLWGDGGGQVQAAGGPLRGRDEVARLIADIGPSTGKGLDIAYRSVNGDPSALLFAGGTPYAVIVLDLTPDGDQVCGIYAVSDPDKLSHVD
ncbi:RNA polymerase sigma-70 factor (ECF subfamily) [Kibdelosporangium banguiense]|uniref:RNA polymerase sigma-70 factor (ECF subfamily) n=1 Tax=Kibdelosporangium banguiense TaxID=1365924 RepID=A0ABS4TV26_9PSEU|nr:RNA polymerase sigma factor SigJ [Kibdelosporangium banguiense]MBP2327788.1 RNA polymerase sigma-70 factor (ECF subfamily) [Kibdelosporangium banguiense]